MASLRAMALTTFGGMLSTIVIAGAFAVGCGDDTGGDGGTPDGSGAPDSTTDSTPEATTETGPTQEGGGADAALEAEAAAHDAGGSDATNHPDAADAGSSDAAPDAAEDAADGGKVIPPGLLAYPQQYANAICTGLSTCCGGTFDLTGCESTGASGFLGLNPTGYDLTLPADPNTYDAGNLTFDATQAAACVNALQAWPCGATLSGAQNQAILSACHGVLGGTLPIGGGTCISSFECAGAAYCSGGVCLALAGDGGTCVANNSEGEDVNCRQVATGLPSQFCNVYLGDAADPNRTGTCAPAQAAGGICSDFNFYSSDYACVSETCDGVNTGTCADPIPNPAQAMMGFFCRDFRDQ